MYVVFFRHATRDTLAPNAIAGADQHDQHLNETGRRQALELVELVQPKGPLPKPTHLYCSPKKRARETMQPLATTYQTRLSAEPELDERGDRETHASLTKRVRKWIGNIQFSMAASDAIYVCSHYDWLAEALVIIPSNLSELEQNTSFSPAEFRVFEIRDGIWYLV